VLVSGVFARPPFTDASGRPIGLPWSLDLLPFVLAIFVAGVLLSRTSMIRACPMPAAVIVGACTVLAFLVAHGVSLDLNYRRMTNALAVLAGIAAGIGLVFAVATLVARVPAISRVFAYLGSASLVILLLHSPLQRRALDGLAAHGVSGWLAVVLSVAVTVGFISAFDIWILRRVRALGWVVYPRREVAKPA
jgi:fucose 4-O-acetylase-like acetyltransferase